MTTLNSDARRLNVKGLLIAVGLPVVLVGALVATLLGTGAFSRDQQGEDASMWLWTTPAGEIARVNGLTAATDARFEVTDAAGNPVQIEQTDTHLLLRNIATGDVSAVDLSTLSLTGEAETAPGEGVRVALHEDGAFIVDQVQGLISQVDPETLAPVGEALSFPAGLTGGAFDRDGSLWVGVPGEGTVVEIRPQSVGAKTVATTQVAEPRQDLALTVLGDGVAVLNATVQTMTTLRADGRVHEAEIELLGPAETAETSPGHIAAVTVTDPPSVVTVDDDKARRFDIGAGSSQLLGAAMEFHQRVYVPDGAAGIVWVYDLDGNELDKIEIDSGGGPVELYHSGDTLFANAVNTNHAVVVSSDGNARLAEKDRDDILGGNAPPENDDESGGDEEGEGDGGSGEEVGPPGAVTNLAGTVGDGLINLSWDAAPNNGSALTKYVIEGAGNTWEIAPTQRVLEIDGLANGEAYTFTVTAHNAIGAGDTATSPSIVPSAEVPDPPSGVEAVAEPDGTVEVTWDEADGQGNEITGYQVESINGDGERTVVGQADGTTFVVPVDTLTYDMTQYAFSVTTLSGSAASEPSEQSDSVVPFKTPEPPTNLLAETATDAAGSIDVTWNQPKNNGRPIDKYIVRAGNQTKEVSGQTHARVDGFADGQQVNVTVTAVNEAGESEPAETTSNTMKKPTVQISSTSSTPTSVTIKTAFDDGGGKATCKLYRGKGVVDSGACGTLVDSDRYASTEGTYQVEISNAAGTSTSANQTVSTTVIKGKVHWDCPKDLVYCNSGDGSNGIGIHGNTQQNDLQGRTDSGDVYQALCWTTGDKITPRGDDQQEVGGGSRYHDYHPGKDATDKWIRIEYQKVSYIPFAWFDVNGVGKNSTGDLPRCN
ncbi:hypothetical protein GCM10027447_01670 [Glycomyces halotolerans]